MDTRILTAWRRCWWLLAPALGILAYRGVAGFEFIGDAHFLILENRFMREPGMAWQQVVHNYFWSSSGNIIPYWRPWTKLSWYWEYQLFGPSPAGFMAVQVAWHLVGAVGAQALARALGAGRAAATAAGVIFALHPVAMAPVCMLMARSDVVAAACLVWGAVAWIRWCAGGRWQWLILLAAALLLGLASKEAAVIGPLIMAAWVAVLGRTRGEWRRWLPPLVAAVVVAGLYFMLRRALLTADAAGLASVSLELDATRVWAGLAKYLQNLFPLWLTSGVRDVTRAEAVSGPFLLAGAVALAVMTGVCVWAWRRGEVALIWLVGWALLALGPVLVTSGIHVPASEGKYPMADRWLYHALAPAAVLWGLLLQGVGRRLSLAGGQARSAAAVVLALWAAGILFGSGAATREFGSVDGMLDNEDRAFYRATPARFRTEEDECRYLDRKVVRALRSGDHAGVSARAGEAIQRCGESPERGHWRLSSLVATGKFSEAEPLARRLVKRPPRDRRGHAELAHLAGQVFLRSGHPGDAEQWLGTAVKLGARGCRLLVSIAEAQRAQGKAGPAARHLARAYQCGGRKDASLLLMAATLVLQSGDKEAAKRLLGEAGRHQLRGDQAAQAERIRKGLATGKQEPEMHR